MDSTEKQIIEYIWLDGDNNLRSKARVFNEIIFSVHITHSTADYYLRKLPNWNYDGSSTSQAKGTDSEVIIKPRYVTCCPFRRGNHMLALCDTYDKDDNPLPSNHRVNAVQIFEQNKDLRPWYGIEQEFFLIDVKTGKILGFDYPRYKSASKSDEPYPKEQGQYYCSIGANNAFGREIVEAAFDNMIYAGLNVSGINAEVAPGQWEYQIGPVEGIKSADQHYISRYILERTAEKFSTIIEYHPKPLGSHWNGSGCHVNFSTEPMRKENGIVEIEKAIEKLSLKHAEHMEVYGKDNNLRMTGQHETASYDTFTHGKANRGASIRIGNSVYKDKCGYFEDRRPASNMDPYRVTSIIFKTCCLD